jgi:hypothetical protein
MALSGFLAAVNIKKEFYGFPKFQVSGWFFCFSSNA